MPQKKTKKRPARRTIEVFQTVRCDKTLYFLSKEYRAKIRTRDRGGAYCNPNAGLLFLSSQDLRVQEHR